MDCWIDMNFFSFMDVPEHYQYNKLFLVFTNREIERKFRERLNLRSVNKTRLAIVLGITLYSVFMLLDLHLIETGLFSQMAIRLGAVVPLLVLMLAATFLPKLHPKLQWIAGTSILGTQLGHSVMPVFASLPAGYLMSCTNLVIFFLFVFSGLRFASSLVMAAFLIPLYLTVELLFIQPETAALSAHLFFVLSTTMIGILAGYIIERSQRVEYVQQELLHEQHNKIENELMLARKIQSQLIPPFSPAEYLSFRYHPMELVGGDFFDFVPFREPHRTGIFISDVSGHGVPAAFITSMLKSILLQSGERREDPAQLLSYINQVIERQTDGNFITALYGIYDRRKRSFVFANAGHNDPLLIGDEVLYLNSEKSSPIAVPWELLRPERKRPIVNNTTSLPQGSKLLLYTDGFTETTPTNSIHDFETTGMKEVLLQYRRQPCAEFVTSVFNGLVDFNGRNKFEDDICLVCLDV